MKSLGGEGQLIRKAGLTPQQCIRFALSQPIATLVSGMDSIEVVDQNVAIAGTLAGIAPAIHAARTEIVPALRQG